MTYGNRNDLHQRFLDAFTSQPEIFQIFFFGKELEGKEDEYSDLDVVVCSANLATTQANYRSLFHTISPIIGTFLLDSSADNLSEMIMLQDYSPYQKIDFSIVNQISYKQQVGFGPFCQAYEKKLESSASPTKLDVQTINDIQNQLNDFLFSVPRFTKCLFRRDMDMFRRWKSISEMTLVLLHEKYTGWRKQGTKDKLLAKEASLVYSAIDDREKEILERIFPLDAELNLARSYQRSIELLIELMRQKARYFGAPLDDSFIEYISHFLNAEVNRFWELRTG